MAFSEVEMLRPGEDLTGECEPDALYQAGLAYSLGSGVEADLVEAHKWFNLACLRGSEEARELRQEMADQMSAEEIKLALRAAREWLKQVN